MRYSYVAMKIHFSILVVFLLITTALQAQIQPYNPFIHEGAYWKMARWNYPSGTQGKTFKLLMHGDTTVNNTVYKKLYFAANGAYQVYSLLREDTAVRKVYSITLPNQPAVFDSIACYCPLNQEFLLFDFSKNVAGDTLFLCAHHLNPASVPDTCADILAYDSYVMSSYDGIDLLGYGFMPPSIYPQIKQYQDSFDIWFVEESNRFCEMKGSRDTGPLPISNIFGYSEKYNFPSFKPFFQLDKYDIIPSLTPADLLLDVKSLSTLFFTLSPVPAQEQIVIRGDATESAISYTLTDIQGKACLSGVWEQFSGQETLPLLALSNGLYVLHLQTANGGVASYKFSVAR